MGRGTLTVLIGLSRKFNEFYVKYLAVSIFCCTFATDMEKKLRTIRNSVILVLLMALVITACGRTVKESASDFVTVENGHIVR